MRTQEEPTARRSGSTSAFRRRMGDRHENARAMVQHLRALFEELQVDCVLDVGANEGQFVSVLRDDVGFTGRVVSFEPVASTYARLVANRSGDHRWCGRQVALGSAAGTAEINTFAQSELNSFLSPSSYATDLAEQFGLAPEAASVVQSETVNVCRLEDEWDAAVDGCRSVFLKLDCQGRDLDVLAGAGDVAGSVRGLLTEIALQPIYDGMPSLTESLEFLLGLGFDVTGLFHELRDPDLRVVEVNCVLRRTP